MKETGRGASGNRGLALLDETIAYVESHPEDWDQSDYRCGSGMCVSGWAATLAGGQWVTGPDEYGSCWLRPEPGDNPDDLSEWNGALVAHPHNRAQRLLELTEEQADDLFGGSNDLEYIKIIRDEIADAA